MNVENILKVADAIEKHEIAWLGFNMRSWYADRDDGFTGFEYDDLSGHKCGTVACIAGWATAVEVGELVLIKELENSRLEGRKLTSIPLVSEPEDFLGLDNHQAGQLFHGARVDTTAAHAVRALRHLAATGKVDWTV